MIFSTLTPVAQRLWGGTRPLRTVVLGLAATVALVSCGPLSGAWSDLTAPRAEESAQTRATPPTAGVLVRKFEPRYESNITLSQFRQADEYMRIMAPAEMHAPLLLATRYAQTEHMPILIKGKEGNLSRREFTNWGFFAFIADFNAHVRIVEGQAAQPAMPADTYVEAVMTTEKLAQIGAKVGDRLILVHRPPGGSPEPIEVKIVGRWSPIDPDEMYWFYDSGYFSEAVMVAEETYVDVLLPGWDEIGYEYTWFAVYDVNENNSEFISTGISQIRANLADMVGDVKIAICRAEICLEQK